MFSFFRLVTANREPLFAPFPRMWRPAPLLLGRDISRRFFALSPHVWLLCSFKLPPCQSSECWQVTSWRGFMLDVWRGDRDVAGRCRDVRGAAQAFTTQWCVVGSVPVWLDCVFPRQSWNKAYHFQRPKAEEIVEFRDDAQHLPDINENIVEVQICCWDFFFLPMQSTPISFLFIALGLWFTWQHLNATHLVFWCCEHQAFVVRFRFHLSVSNNVVNYICFPSLSFFFVCFNFDWKLWYFLDETWTYSHWLLVEIWTSSITSTHISYLLINVCKHLVCDKTRFPP